MNYTATYKNIQHYSDSEIIQEILLGNYALFEILIRRYNPFLYKAGRGYGYDHQDTEDMMQEVFLLAKIIVRLHRTIICLLFSFIFVGEIVGEILFYGSNYKNPFIQLQDKKEW